MIANAGFDWHTKSVTLSETKGLTVRFFAEPVLSPVEGLRMTRLRGHVVKCTNIMCSGLVTLYYSTQVAGQVRGTKEAKRRDLSRFLAFCYDPFRHYHPRHVVNPTSLIRLPQFVRADAESDFPVRPFEKIEQFVRGQAAKMTVRDVLMPILDFF